MNSKQEETRKKVIKAASELFNELGYENISMREIAKRAEINLASINYYFESKQNLLGEILKRGYLKLEQRIELLFCEYPDDSFVDSVQRLFDFFNRPGFRGSFLNSFKIFLNPEIGFKPLENEDINQRPPGFKALFKKLTLDAGDTISDEDKVWLIKILFTYINHHALLGEVLGSKVDIAGSFLDSTVIKDDLLRLTRHQLKALTRDEKA
jgi:AcrR family transcriptional regulator